MSSEQSNRPEWDPRAEKAGVVQRHVNVVDRGFYGVSLYAAERIGSSFYAASGEAKFDKELRAPSSIGGEEPLLRFGYSAAKELMDQLWSMGIRPSKDRHQKEVGSARVEHINDLRRVTDELWKRLPTVDHLES